MGTSTCKASSHHHIKGIIPVIRKWDGLKKCSGCEIVLDTQDSRCPCCNRVLRTKPKNLSLKARNRYEKTHQIKRY